MLIKSFFKAFKLHQESVFFSINQFHHLLFLQLFWHLFIHFVQRKTLRNCHCHLRIHMNHKCSIFLNCSWPLHFDFLKITTTTTTFLYGIYSEQGSSHFCNWQDDRLRWMTLEWENTFSCYHCDLFQRKIIAPYPACRCIEVKSLPKTSVSHQIRSVLGRDIPP